MDGGFGNNFLTVWMVVLTAIWTALDGYFWQRFGRCLDGCFDIELREQKSRYGGMNILYGYIRGPRTVVHKDKRQYIDSMHTDTVGT